MKTVKFDMHNTKPISDKLYGLFFEDINFSIDGGINSNQINNARYNFRYRKPKKNIEYFLRKIKKYRKRITYKEHEDYFRYWHTQGGIAVSRQFGASYSGREKSFPLLKVSGEGVLYHLGYNGGNSTEKEGRYYRNNAELPAIGVKQGKTYDCKFWIKNSSFIGDLEVFAEANGESVTDTKVVRPTIGNWTKIEFSLKARKTAIGRFSVNFSGNGALCLDAFYFGDTDALGANDPVWSGGKMRRDLVEALRELKPSFIRFPGGCIVEGYDIHNSYYWKNTVGDPAWRNPQLNLWGEGQEDGGYLQSYEIGFYEYFLLCEHLNAQPLPIINAGLACQGRSLKHFSPDQPEFQRYIDDALDLIEYANGDPKTSKWAKLRADSGHPAPFGLKMLGIGNENWGDVYLRNFGAIRAAVKERYPDIEIVFSAGFDCYKHKNYELRRAGFDGVHDDCIVDDHFYRKPSWCIENADLYDDYNRKIRVFLGEYAANTPWDDRALPNNYYSALAEAAFLTHIERNADRVVMSSYAPLFSRVGGEQWKHNLINFNSLYTLRTANFYVQKLFGQNIGNRYIPDSGDAEGIYRAATTDGKAVFIKLVNINTEAKEICLVLDGANITKAGAMQTMSCTDDYAKNTLDYFGEPQEPLRPAESIIDFINGVAQTVLPPRSVCVIQLTHYS